LIDAGVRRVVVACKDPNPVAEGGLKRLAEVGIETEVGLMADLAYAANEQFLTALALQRPYVVVKAAMTLDGRIALPSGESKWITSAQSRRVAHRLRAECGAVLVGRKTVEADNPLLTARLPGLVNQPLRVVLDPNERLTGNESVFHQPGESIRITSSLAPITEKGFDLRALLDLLWKRRVMGLLVEGGAHTITSFIENDLVDRYELFVAPKLFGAGPSWLNDLATSSISDCHQLQIVRTRRLGPDFWVTAKPLRR
jgi:diaminohydroxyphosphoribosylaminopyrimidine deaminase/5-amino-6-(5-phosphoribosylamino)uracil reductase